MAASSAAEREMNLTALQQRDPYITGIADSATQVAVYSFNSGLNEWEKTNVEGTLFVYSRSAFPINGFMIINRLHLNDLIEPINKNLEFQLQDPFLLYRNGRAAIFGIWFYDRDECARIGQLMNSLVQVAIQTQQKDSMAGRQRRASESDTTNDVRGTGDEAKAADQKNVDILQMLSKAQDEYDKSKSQTTKKPGVGAANNTSSAANNKNPSTKGKTGRGVRQPSDPSPLLDDPALTSNSKGNKILKPTAFKGNELTSTSHDAHYSSRSGATGGGAELAVASSTQISLKMLFDRASMQQEAGSADGPAADQIKQASQAGIPLLQHFISNTTMVEEIEREHRGGSVSRDAPQQRLQNSSNGPSSSDRLLGGAAEPESPNTAIRRTLNIAPPNIKMNAMQSQPYKQERSGLEAAFQAIDMTERSNFAASDAPKTSKAPALNAGLQDRVPVSSIFQMTGIPSPPVTTNTSHDLTKPMNFAGGLLPGVGLSAGATGACNLLSSLASSTGLGRINHPLEQLTTPDTFLSSALKSDNNSAGSILMSPMVFQTSTFNKQTQDVPHGEPADSSNRFMQSRTPVSDNQQPVSPLTKDQLLQAVIHVMKTDPSFLSKVHEAYIATLNLGSRSSKP